MPASSSRLSIERTSNPLSLRKFSSVEREHVLGPLRRSIVARAVLLATRHLFKVRRATGAHPVRHHRLPCPSLLCQSLAPAVILLQAGGALHDVVRRHATTLRAAVCITVFVIAVLLYKALV